MWDLRLGLLDDVAVQRDLDLTAANAVGGKRNFLLHNSFPLYANLFVFIQSAVTVPYTPSSMQFCPASASKSSHANSASRVPPKVQSCA